MKKKRADFFDRAWVSLVGLVIALAAWMRKKKELCCDDFDDDLFDGRRRFWNTSPHSMSNTQMNLSDEDTSSDEDDAE